MEHIVSVESWRQFVVEEERVSVVKENMRDIDVYYRHSNNELEKVDEDLSDDVIEMMEDKDTNEEPCELNQSKLVEKVRVVVE
ncbi:hypothetical protein RJT34_16653 [Clitoria ternatea]|uniref:Uncharacterized protein n=1 Tax=Clitoria ternatea TaxID=43366 RepID=A0AAN9PDV1_CLITE